MSFPKNNISMSHSSNSSSNSSSKSLNKNIFLNKNMLSDNNREMYDLCHYITNLLLHEMQNIKATTTKNNIVDIIYDATIKRYKYMKPKKRNRKVINKENMCMGRKLDYLQCTRKRLPGQEYCLSHVKNRPNGRIDQEHIIKKSKGKRGRKRKNNYDPKLNDKEYLTMWEVIIDNEKYLCDKNQYIYTFDKNKPKYLGKMTLDNKIDPQPANLITL